MFFYFHNYKSRRGLFLAVFLKHIVKGIVKIITINTGMLILD